MLVHQWINEHLVVAVAVYLALVTLVLFMHERDLRTKAGHLSGEGLLFELKGGLMGKVT